MSSAYRNFLTFGAHQKPTVGDTKTSVISNDHMGWLKCDGRSVAVSDFEFLFNVVGYSFGGSGDNFNLPNAAGRVPGIVGTGTDSNLTNSTLTLALGSTIGEYQHTLTISEMPAHTHGSTNVSGNTNGDGFVSTSGAHDHSITDPGHQHGITNVPYGTQSVTPLNASACDETTQNVSTSVNTTGITINTNGAHNHAVFNTGGSNPHNNIQPTIGMGNMFIYCGRPTYPFLGFPYTQGTLIY
jgi:microcystin-dependent protein